MQNLIDLVDRVLTNEGHLHDCGKSLVELSETPRQQDKDAIPEQP